jgi:putative transposase
LNKGVAQALAMANYRRFRVPGATVFLTIVTFQRAPLLSREASVELLRTAMRQVMNDQPFEVPAAVVLPDHVHFLWTMPTDDSDYSRRVGRIKALFSRSFRDEGHRLPGVGESRRRHREANVWQRRFWEHTILDERDFEDHLHYIHYNPVMHGCATCPHLWPYSSFDRWVRSGFYDQQWGCSCAGRIPELPRMAAVDHDRGE